VSELADRVTVLRDGVNAGELPRDEATHDRMVRLMVGRDVARFYDHHVHPTGAPVLEARGVRMTTGGGHPLSLQVRAGEIVGLAGLVGAGRTELLETLFGIRPVLAGEILVADRPVRMHSPRQAIRHGLALVPEDRRLQGLVVEMAVRENVSLTTIGRDARVGFIDRRRADAICREMSGRLAIRASGPRQVVEELSGGNQQKVVLGKWLALRPRVLLLDEPTRGIDVGAKEEIYRLMEQLAAKGVGILFASSDLEEILGMSDRTVVMHEGRIAGALAREQLTAESVMGLATGAAPSAAEALA
jgi:ribose transport system ATP-binding protein